MRPYADELALILTLEQGKPLSDAKGEIQNALDHCEAVAAMDLSSDVVRDDDTEYIEVRHTPVGVVGAITPWNFPIMVATWKIAPALLAGNTVILKPSPFTPATTLRFGEIAAELLPPGVFQVLAGGDDLGRTITRHPGVNKIAFTGSVRAGREIMTASGPTLKRLTLELGGNAPPSSWTMRTLNP